MCEELWASVKNRQILKILNLHWWGMPILCIALQHSFSLSWFASARRFTDCDFAPAESSSTPIIKGYTLQNLSFCSVLVHDGACRAPWLTGSIRKALQDQVCVLHPSPHISGSAQAIVLDILLSSVMFFSGLPGTLRNSAHNICFELSSLSSQVGRRCCFPLSIFNVELLLTFVYWI